MLVVGERRNRNCRKPDQHAQGGYLGTLEVSQDLTEKRALQGEQRLLEYAED